MTQRLRLDPSRIGVVPDAPQRRLRVQRILKARLREHAFMERHDHLFVPIVDLGRGRRADLQARALLGESMRSWGRARTARRWQALHGWRSRRIALSHPDLQWAGMLEHDIVEAVLGSPAPSRIGGSVEPIVTLHAASPHSAP